MAKVDLHVHSSYSDRPSEWFLKRLGARESYIEPEELYRIAKNEGMDFVTITDHNSIQGVLQLQQNHPDDVFTGVELTAYFPEDGVKIHILVWGLDEYQFRILNEVRQNIYNLRETLIEMNLPHAVAHATFSINNLLSFEHVERLFLLFDYFETINGARNKQNNDALDNVLKSLTPGRLIELSEAYFLQQNNETSFQKGCVGGSDDHSGLFIGQTYTEAKAESPKQFLEQILLKQTRAKGRHNDYRGLAFAIYKIAYDFAKSKNSLSSSFYNSMNELLFENKKLDFKKKVLLEKFKISKKHKNDTLKKYLLEIVYCLQSSTYLSSDEKLELISDKVTNAVDELFKNLFDKIGDNLKTGDLIGVLQSASSFLPGIFLSIPFFTSLNILTEARWLIDKLNYKYLDRVHRPKKRIVWFTDTFYELSGVCATLQEIASLADQYNYDLIIATCLPPDKLTSTKIPKNIINLPCVQTYTPHFFNTYTLRVPAVLSSIKMIYELEPDEIYISTPGMVGLLGLLSSKLLHVPSTAVYHTDFTRQARQLIGDETVCRITEDFVNWFHSAADSIAVPTKEYIDLLTRRGIPQSKMKKFRRAINPDLFNEVSNAPKKLRELLNITNNGTILLHSGRVSKEKNMDFLESIYRKVLESDPTCNLVFVGDGPYFDTFRTKVSDLQNVYFAGRINRDELPLYYSGADFLVFPSVTDTFGMVVLEAQACGLPAIVSNVGGPQEIIISGKTGYVAEAGNLDDWTNKIIALNEMVHNYPKIYRDLRIRSRYNAKYNYSWKAVFEDIFESEPVIQHEQKFRDFPVHFNYDLEFENA